MGWVRREVGDLTVALEALRIALALVALAPPAALVAGIVMHVRKRPDASGVIAVGVIATFLEAMFIWFTMTTTFPPPS